MSTGYLKNILDKNNLVSLVVEPRLKSRYETSTNVDSVDNIALESNLDYSANQNKITTLKENKILKDSVFDNDELSSSEILNTSKKASIINNLNDKETPILQDFNISEEKNEHTISEEISKPLLENQKQELESTKLETFNISESVLNETSIGILNPPKLDTKTKENQNHTGDFLKDKNSVASHNEIPTIKISIGRIEVKGVKDTPPKKPRQKATTSLKLSLEDYIDRKNNRS